MEDAGFLKRKLENGGSVNRDVGAPITMRAAGEVGGLDLPRPDKVHFPNPYLQAGGASSDYLPGRLARFVYGDEDDFSREVFERTEVIKQRDAEEAEFLSKTNVVKRFYYKLILG
ncbi:MAG TPA: hypothetical protein VK534_00100 [Methylomirabilota bacterium]|nr:hypothetical protein [Methylomirabilota bacterium]